MLIHSDVPQALSLQSWQLGWGIITGDISALPLWHNSPIRAQLWLAPPHFVLSSHWCLLQRLMDQLSTCTSPAGRGTATADTPLRLRAGSTVWTVSVHLTLSCLPQAVLLRYPVSPQLSSCPSWSPNHWGVFPRCGTSPLLPLLHSMDVGLFFFSFLLSFFHPACLPGYLSIGLLSAQGSLLVFSGLCENCFIFRCIPDVLWERCAPHPLILLLTPHRKVLEDLLI